MDDIIYMSYDSENRRVVFVTDKPEVVYISNYEAIVEPKPEPEPEVYDLEWDAYVEDGDNYTKINERFEVLEGKYENGLITFHFKSLQDKLSAQEGALIMDPVNLHVELDNSLSGSGTLTSPRKPDFPARDVKVEKAVGIGVYFVVDGTVVQGDAETSAGDHPYNWHYGLEIAGSIVV